MSHVSLSREEAEEIYLIPKYIESNAVIAWETRGDNPKEIEKLGWKEGEELEPEIDDNRLIIKSKKK